MFKRHDCEEYEECDGHPDPDYYYDMVRDDFLTEINSEEDAIEMIKRYPSMIRYLPTQYRHLLPPGDRHEY